MKGSQKKYILAIDLGTSAVKTALVSIFGEVIGWEEKPLLLHLLPDGGAEQSPDDWWNGITSTSRKLLGRGLISPEEVAAVCATTQGAGTVPVDRDGRALMNCITWLDSRGARHIQANVKGLINVEGYDLLRLLRQVSISGGVPARSGKDITGHMLFVKNERPDVYEKTYKFLNVLDYINMRLTGEFLATGDSVYDTWMLDSRNPDCFHYHQGLLKGSAISADRLPEIRRNIDIIGTLRPEAASELGLSRAVKVVAGALDYTSAAIGSGAIEDYHAHLYIGTSSWLVVHIPFKKTDLLHYLASLPCAIPGKYLVIATQDNAGGNLTYLRDRLIFHKDAVLQVESKDFYRGLNEVAGQVPPGSNGLIYTPWLYGERCPVDNSFLRAGIHNLSLENTRSDLARAFLEGVALNTRWMLGPAEKFISGRKIDSINMIGGGASSDLWCQIHADILNRSIRQVREPVQANARGAAFIAGVGLGEIQFNDIPNLIQYQGEYEPDPKNRGVYDELFEVFVEIYRKNKGIYERLNKKKI
jgi:xylulokinase